MHGSYTFSKISSGLHFYSAGEIHLLDERNGTINRGQHYLRPGPNFAYSNQSAGLVLTDSGKGEYEQILLRVISPLYSIKAIMILGSSRYLNIYINLP